MPYGRPYRRNYRKSTRTYRRTSTKKMPPIPRTKRTTRTYTRKNAIAVRSLARDVRYLKMARHGEVQTNLQILTRPLRPTSSQPCFCVINDIQADNPVSGNAGAPWYQLNAGGASTITSNFQRNNDTFYNLQNNDIVDTGSFFLSGLKLTFRLDAIPVINPTVPEDANISNKRVRIDIFKQRSRALKTPISLGDIQQLPAVNAQTRLSNMATPTLNKFNPYYFELIATKFVFMNPSKVQPFDKGTSAGVKYVSMKVPFKHLGKFTQQVSDPSTPQDPSGPGYGVSNFPIHQRIWCMVSSDITPTQPDPNQTYIEVSCQRCVTWRDSIGSASL